MTAQRVYHDDIAHDLWELISEEMGFKLPHGDCWKLALKLCDRWKMEPKDAQ
jgi:hypothetical protein